MYTAMFSSSQCCVYTQQWEIFLDWLKGEYYSLFSRITVAFSFMKYDLYSLILRDYYFELSVNIESDLFVCETTILLRAPRWNAQLLIELLSVCFWCIKNTLTRKLLGNSDEIKIEFLIIFWPPTFYCVVYI